MIEVQICRRSPGGVVIPIARDDDPALVRYVARVILKQMENWRFEDKLLAEVAARHRRGFKEALAKEGIALDDKDDKEAR